MNLIISGGSLSVLPAEHSKLWLQASEGLNIPLLTCSPHLASLGTFMPGLVSKICWAGASVMVIRTSVRISSRSGGLGQTNLNGEILHTSHRHLLFPRRKNRKKLFFHFQLCSFRFCCHLYYFMYWSVTLPTEEW